MNSPSVGIPGETVSRDKREAALYAPDAAWVYLIIVVPVESKVSVKPLADAILGFDLSHGGHLSHGSPVNLSGKLYQANFYGVEKETGIIDLDKMEKKALEVKPKLIIDGASPYTRVWYYARM